MTFKEWMLDRLDAGQIEDICDHGVDGGFPGLTYYSDTCKLYEEHKEEIWDALFEDADSLGYKTALDLMADFGTAKNVGSADQFENMLTWYMAERVARDLVDNRELPEDDEEEETA